MLDVRVLGEVAVHVHGQRVDLGPARQRCVWAALAVDVGRVVPVERLVERVWGEDPPPKARTALLSYVSRLRRVLPEAPTAVVVRRSGGYLLAVEESAVDLHRFRTLSARAGRAGDVDAVRLLTEALALWRGEALTGLGGEWATAERDRLGRERLAAQHDLVDARLRLGQGEELVAELAARQEEHPLDERVAGQLLLALHRAGRTADALEHHRRLRERLVEELGADPAPALQELHRRILDADPALTPAEAVTTAGGPPRSAVPRQLPAPPRWFTGRAGHLAALDAALDHQGAAVVSAIGGAGGVGKTWLALTWAHRHLDRFPDGQLFVDLRGFSPDGDAIDPAVALRGFLDALGVAPDRVPVDLEARAALYRSLVADRRVLVVLDNAATTEQVVPLLPGGPSCAALVTSRHRLRGLTARHGAHPLPLGVLTDAESRALLTTALGPDPVADDRATAELIALCGGFPLALGLAAARARPDLPLSEVVTELRESGLDALDADDPTASLPAVLSWSLRHLTDRQRTAFALLGIAPGPDIDLPAAAGLTGLPEREARAELRALTDASLLDRNAGGRYAMHDLVRAYATSTAHDLPDPVRRAALERVLDFYLHTARTADRLLDPHRTPIPFEPPVPGARPHALGDPLAAQAWLDTHHPHLLATQRAAAAHHRHRTAWRTAWTLSTFHWWRSLRHDELAAWQVAADAAAHLPDPTTRILTHRFLGRAHIGLVHHDEAVAHLDRALTLAEHHCDTGQQADTHYALSWLWDLRGDDRKALEHVLRALAFYRDLGRPVQEAEALNVAGWHTARLDDHDTARHHCEAALVLHRRHGNPEGEASTLDSLGYIDHRTGRHHRATRHYREALALLRDLGNATQVAHTLDGIGHPHAALGQHDRARAAWREALELYREQGRAADAQRVRRQLDALGPGDDPPTGPAT